MMTTDGMYILRYSLPPEPTEARPRRLSLLEQFCDDARIDEVMFFLLPEVYNRGQWRRDDYLPWLEFAVEAKQRLEARGLQTSLNPWHTLLHVDRGRRSEDLTYRRMVLDTGQTCLSVACPLCPQWRRLFYQAFRDFAEAGFKVIWVEDDFRFHNHNPGAWGGCFCDEHLRVLKERGMQAADRQQLIRNLNARGQVHPDRLIWMELMRDTTIDVIAGLRREMDRIDPQIKLGLMTSVVAQHCLEGRDWRRLIDALGGPQRAPIRPHSAPYHEASRHGFVEYLGNLSMTLDVLPEGARTFFELENAPMSRFSKSQQHTSAQMAFAIEGGCDGVTLDVLDFLGTGPASEPMMAATLAADKPRLLRLRGLMGDTQPVGIEAVLPTNTVEAAPGAGVDRIDAIPNIHYGWFNYLQACGYPCRNRGQVEAVDPEKVYALAGPPVWALQTPLLEEMLGKATVLLDAQAAQVILNRGLGELIALRDMRLYTQDVVQFSFEQAVEPYGDDVPQRAGVNMVEDVPGYQVATFDTTDRAEVKTELFDCYHNCVGKGSYLYRNPQGGGGVVTSTTLPLPDRLFNWCRKRWIDQWLRAARDPVPVPYLVDSPWVYIAAGSGDALRTIFLMNATFETYETLRIALPPEWAKLDWSVELHGRDRQGTAAVEDSSHLIINTQFVGSDWLLLVGR